MKKKLLIIIAAMLVTSTILTGCGKGKGTTVKTDKSDSTKTTQNSDTASGDKKANQITAENLKPAVETANDKKIIMKINGDPVSYAEYRYYFMNYKSKYDNGDDTFWTKNPDAITSYKKDVLSLLTMNRVVTALAKEENIKLTKEEQKTKVDTEVATQLNQIGGDFDKYYTSDKVIRYTQEVYAIYEKLNNAYNAGEGKVVKVTDDEAAKYAKDNDYIMAKHILIKTQDLKEDEKAKKLELAKQVLAKAKNGEDFDALIKQYGEDPGMQSNPGGYVFKKGDMVTEFETAAYALGENQISDLVETTYGYHIIKKLKNDEKTVLKAVKEKMVLQKFDDYMKEKIDKAKITYTDKKAFDKYDFTTLKK